MSSLPFLSTPQRSPFSDDVNPIVGRISGRCIVAIPIIFFFWREFPDNPILVYHGYINK